MATQAQPQSLTTARSNSDEALNFDLLKFELVDMDQQLYLQLAFFTLFPKLPMELRLKIWRRTFPDPRRISLSSQWSTSNVRGDSIIPISMWINVESRTETLKHYFLLDPRLLEAPLNRADYPVLCFNTTKDLISDLPYFRSLRTKILRTLSAQGPSYMPKVHHVRIQIGLVDGYFKDFQPRFEQNKATGKLREIYEADAYGTYLFHFPGLKKITIKMYPCSKDLQATMLNTVKGFVNYHKQRFYGNETPQVVVIGQVSGCPFQCV